MWSRDQFSYLLDFEVSFPHCTRGSNAPIPSHSVVLCILVYKMMICYSNLLDWWICMITRICRLYDRLVNLYDYMYLLVICYLLRMLT